MIKTAVIMATYNGEKFIENQLDSIRSQELKVDYVLLRDDCSTDDTVKLVKEYISENGLENWSIIQNDVNLGWQKNFRLLLQETLDLDIEYVLFSDQDDVWALDKVKEQVEIMEANEDYQVLSGDVEIRNVEGGDYHKLPFQFSNSDSLVSKFPPNIEYSTYRLGWTFIVRHNLIEDIMEFWKPEYFIAHDVVFSVLSSLLGSGYNLNKDVGVHVVHNRNASIKPSITLSSSKAHHVRHLLKEVQFYKFIYKVLEKKNSSYLDEINKKLKFCEKRYKLAEENKKLAVFLQVLKDGKMYSGTKSKFRDIFFAFKS